MQDGGIHTVEIVFLLLLLFVNDELLRQLERELDLAEARFLTGGA